MHSPRLLRSFRPRRNPAARCGLPLLALVAVLAAAEEGRGQPPAAKDRAAADTAPLPAGAVTRLGSARFRFDGSPYCPPAFSPDGQLVAVGSPASVAVFDTDIGRRVHRFVLIDGHHPRFVRFLADGKRLAVGSGDWQQAAELTIWDVATEKALATANFTGKSQIFVIDISSDGTRVLVEDRFVKAFLWDVTAAREVWSVEHKEATSTMPFTKDGKNFVVSGYRKTELHDAATGRVVGEYPNPGPGFSQRYSPGVAADGRIAYGDDKGNSVVVLAAEGERRVRLLAAERRAERLAFSPDGRYLVGPVFLGTHVWDLSAPDDKGPVARLPSSTTAAFTPDGKTLALDGNGYLTLWAVGSWRPLAASADPPSDVSQTWFTPDGTGVLGHTTQGWVRWPAGGGPGRRLSDDSTVDPNGQADVSADGRTGLDMLVEPGPPPYGRKAALRVTDLTTGKDRRIPFEYNGWSGVRMSPDGRFAMSYAGTSEFYVWDLATGEVRHRRKSAPGEILFGVTAAPDGKGLDRSVVGIFAEGRRLPGQGPSYSSVTVYDHRAGREWKMEPMPWTVYSQGATFNRDGSLVIVHGRFDERWGNDSVTVWDTRIGRRLMKWDGPSVLSASVALATDNRSLLAGSSMGELALVEVATGGVRVSFRHGGPVASSAFSPDGTKVVSSSPDGPVYIWNVIGEPGRWDSAKADAVWADLAHADAKVAFAAIRKLRAYPAGAITFLDRRVKSLTTPTDEAVTQMLKGLDAAAFAERERAQRDLTAAADLVRPKLEAARKTASEEAGRRLDQVLKAADGWTPDRLRQVRACEVLEGCRTPDAVRVLRAWAAGPAGARLTVEAKASVDRLTP
jgi:WD40 repeat protein